MIKLIWSIGRLSRLIKKMQDMDYDCIICVDGNRGTGKSNFSWVLGRRILGKKWNPWKVILFSRNDVMKASNEKRTVIIGDEFINVAYNRDFYDEEQKDLLKILNMNRDNCNVLLACIPYFKHLDTQMKDLIKIRITMLRRGWALVQAQNPFINASDRWDTKVNEKIERSWYKHGVFKPVYSQLTTFRGFIRVPKMSDKSRELYDKIKHEKRHRIIKQKELERGNEEMNEVEKIVTRLKEGKLSREMIQEHCILTGKKYDTLRCSINRYLIDEGDEKRFGDYIKKPSRGKRRIIGVPKPNNVRDSEIDHQFDEIVGIS